jgi:hypothetical protein
MAAVFLLLRIPLLKKEKIPEIVIENIFKVIKELSH